jgi:ABC-type transport system involved in Fe-S cluster assembly fused permease/ATPase subunit
LFTIVPTFIDIAIALVVFCIKFEWTLALVVFIVMFAYGTNTLISPEQINVLTWRSCRQHYNNSMAHEDTETNE